jgi:acetyl esterase/lipase
MIKISRFFICIGLAMTLTNVTHAQMSSDVAAQVKALGRGVNPPATALIYVPRMLDKEPYASVRVQRDIAYGSDARNLLDVFIPTTASSAPRKVLLFVHGGAFTRGDRRAPGSPFYDNVMLWAAKNNMIGVNMTYRLAPKDTWPAAQQDIGQAVRWIHANMAVQGGDLKQVYLMGHSAGAAHVASYVAHEPSHLVSGSGVAGAMMLSGIFKLAAGLEDTAAVTYYGSDPVTYPERLAQNGLLKTRVPLWMGYAEFDPLSFELQFNNMKDALCSAGRCPSTQIFAGHGHMSELYSINSDDKVVSDALMAFIKAN